MIFFQIISIPIIFNYDYDTSNGTVSGTGKLTIGLDNSNANYDSGATFELNFKAPVHPEATESVIYTDATDYIYYDNTDSNEIDTKLGSWFVVTYIIMKIPTLLKVYWIFLDHVIYFYI